MLRSRVRLVAAIALVSATFVTAALAGAPNRDIVQEIDADDSSVVSITNRLQRVNGILDKAKNRFVAIDAVFAFPPDPCIPVLTHVSNDQPDCVKQLSALNLAHQQSFELQRSVATIDNGSDVYAVSRRITRAVASSTEAKAQLAGIIGPEIAGIIGPEIAGIIGPEIQIIGPELAGIIGPEVNEIIGPEINEIIGPEVTADLAGIIGPELTGIIGPEREATAASVDAAILETQKRLVALTAMKRALATQP